PTKLRKFTGFYRFLPVKMKRAEISLRPPNRTLKLVNYAKNFLRNRPRPESVAPSNMTVVPPSGTDVFPATKPKVVGPVPVVVNDQVPTVSSNPVIFRTPNPARFKAGPTPMLDVTEVRSKE